MSNTDEIDIQFFDCTNWIELSWYSSGGTRAKKVLQNARGDEFYFKCSERKPAKDRKPEKYYKYEFWNEILAHQLGKILQINILRYDIAIYGNEIGCLSPNMIIREKQELIELGRLMTAINPAFLPDKNDKRKEYTFQLLVKTLETFNLTKYLSLFFETLIFDALIGNSDRHQENWAFIADATSQLTTQNPIIIGYAPIYDCGSCLAKEHLDEKIDEILINQELLFTYIRNGKTELHWKGKKLSHFELIHNLLLSEFSGTLLNSAKFLSNWNLAKVEELITKIDFLLPNNWQCHKLPESRKKTYTKNINFALR